MPAATVQPITTPGCRLRRFRVLGGGRVEIGGVKVIFPGNSN
jgi:hypothetical protein